MKLIRTAALVLACLCAYLLVQTRSPVIEDRPSGARVAGAAARAAAIPPYAYFGLAVQVDSAYEPVERYGAMVREVAGLGANAVLFSVNGYQANAGATRIETDSRRTPTDAQWQQLFEIARQQGLHIIFMPKILFSQPRGSEWRGVIDPGRQWDRWFEEYRRFILRWARLAHASGVEVFIIGSELVSTEKHTQRWRDLIAEVRGVFPRGLLTYSANWDHYDSIRFWDDLDLVALTSYHKTADRINPPLPELLSSWERHRGTILRWQKMVGKPILFTEAGWCSQEGCSIEPWNYYRRQEGSAGGMEEQRRNYEAFIRAWRDCPVVAGVLWWEWTPGEGGAADCGYTPKNKPAQLLVQDWFDNLRGSRKNERHATAD